MNEKVCKRYINLNFYFRKMLRKLYDSRMIVAGLMSGTGSNLRMIIEHERRLDAEGGSPYHVGIIFTENPKSSAKDMGAEFNIPVYIGDMAEFYRQSGKPRKDMDVRREFDEWTAKILKEHGVNAIAYAGYMSIATEPLVNAALGINVHPADLSITKPDGMRKYTGAYAVRDAILGGEKELRSTTHLVESEVDAGKIFMISPPLKVILPGDWDPKDAEQVKQVSNEHQERLKRFGDWVIFPKTLEDIARGRFETGMNGTLHFDGKSIPNGLRL